MFFSLKETSSVPDRWKTCAMLTRSAPASRDASMTATIANERERRPTRRMATSLTRDRSALRRLGDAGRSVPRDRDALDRDDDKEERNADGRGHHDRGPGIRESKERGLGDDELTKHRTRPAEILRDDCADQRECRAHLHGGEDVRERVRDPDFREDRELARRIRAHELERGLVDEGEPAERVDH